MRLPNLTKMIFGAAGAALLALTCLEMSAQSPSAHDDPYLDYAEEVFMDMDFEPNLATPVVPEKLKPIIKRHVRRIAEKYKSGLAIDLMRDGEVMVVTIPTDDVFLPNDTLLAPFSSRQLDKLLPLLDDPYEYKVVVSVHTDDTGSESYRELLSQARLNSIYEWFLNAIADGRVSEDIILIPFSMDSSDPIADNLTRKNRGKNRRIEFFFVPGPKMITEADSGQL